MLELTTMPTKSKTTIIMIPMGSAIVADDIGVNVSGVNRDKMISINMICYDVKHEVLDDDDTANR